MFDGVHLSCPTIYYSEKTVSFCAALKNERKMRIERYGLNYYHYPKTRVPYIRIILRIHRLSLNVGRPKLSNEHAD